MPGLNVAVVNNVHFGVSEDEPMELEHSQNYMR